MITTKIRNFLVDSPDVRNRIDGRVYAGRVPDGGQYPCVVQQIVNTEPAFCTVNESGASSSIVTLDVYGKSQNEVDEVSSLIRNRLSGYIGCMGNHDLTSARMISSQNMIERPLDGSSEWIYRNSIDYEFYYHSPIPNHK